MPPHETKHPRKVVSRSARPEACHRSPGRCSLGCYAPIGTHAQSPPLDSFGARAGWDQRKRMTLKNRPLLFVFWFGVCGCADDSLLRGMGAPSGTAKRDAGAANVAAHAADGQVDFELPVDARNDVGPNAFEEWHHRIVYPCATPSEAVRRPDVWERTWTP